MTADAQPSLSPGDVAVDHALAQLTTSFRFILAVTPVNAADECDAFVAGDRREPAFAYRDLEVDPEVVLAELDRIGVDDVDDPTLGHLVRDKHRELTLQAHMLGSRDSTDFRDLSVELFGTAPPDLVAVAESLLREVPVPPSGGDRLDAHAFLELARAEIDAYTSIAPDARMHADVRDDVQGVVVSSDTLLIAADTAVERERARALIHHEIGTHLVTRVNGEAQPLRLLGAGLAGYDETQEGLAVLAEIACGGFTAGRLRQLASRVVAVHELLGGSTFEQSVERLVADGVSVSSAFTTTMRVYRGGGLTKDVVYLRGLIELLRHLAGGGELSHFWRGKFALADLPLVADLAQRGLLAPPLLTPRYLGLPDASSRLAQAAEHADDLPALLRGSPA